MQPRGRACGEVNQMEAWQSKVIEFARAVLHGDDEHRKWLLEAADAFVNGRPLPPPRDAKGQQQ